MESGFNVRVEEAIAVASQEGGDSVQNVNIVDAISEGPIKGLVGGEAGVFLNDIPAEYDEFRSFIPLQYAPDSNTKIGTITFTGGSDVTGSVDSNTTIPADLENNAGAPRLLILTYLTQEVTVSNTPSLTTAEGKTYTLTATSGTPFTTNSEGSEWDSSAREVNTRADIYREGEQFIGRTSYLSTSTISITFKEGNGEGIEPGGTYTLRIYRFIPIVSIDPAQGIVTVEATNAPNAGTYNFGISKQPTQEEIDDANTIGRGNIAQKIDKLTVRLRTGTATQDPLTTIGGVGGSVSISGAVSSVNLPQLKLINPDTNTNTTGIAPIDAAGMPTDSSDFNDSATILSSNAFGLNASTVQEVDEISWSIRYNSLQSTSLTSGKKERAYAFYVMQIALKKDGTGFGEWKDCFPNKGEYVTHYADTSAPTQFDHSLTLEQFRPFVDLKVRIIRITRHLGLPVRADGTSDGETIKKDWQLSAVASISSLGAEIKDKFRYPYTALASLSFNSRQFQNTPKRSYFAEGLLVSIPSNYTPREYSPSGEAVYAGFWDGNFRDSLYYTDNPAWVFYDIIRNNRYGAGKWIEAGDIDKYALYRVARYCDELVDAGTLHNSSSPLIVGNFYKIKTAGTTTWSSVGSSANTADTVFRATAETLVGTGVAIGLEPRFRANIYLAKATDVYKVLKDMATIFLGILYWQDGQLTTVQDTPQDPVYSFSKSNVIEGSFNYQSTGNRTKINQVIVTWNDPTINYEAAPLIVEDRESIARTGKIISESAVAFGATSEAQAFRYGKWKLWTAQNQTEIVSFKTALASSFIKPGDVISIQDANRTGLEHSGRIKSVTGTDPINITFDRDVNFSSGTYDLNVLFTEPAAFWTGVDSLTIAGASKSPYQSGEKVYQAYVDLNDNGTATLVDIDTEERASNAFQDSAMTIPLALEWKDYSYVQTIENISASGLVNNLSIAAADLDGTPVVGTIWGLKKTVDNLTVEGSSKNYKVLSITQDSLTEATISAVEFYNEKFLAVEKDYELGTLPGSVTTSVEGASIPAPENVRVLINSNPAETGEELTVEWDAPSNSQFVAKYEVHHNIEGVPSPLKTATTSILLTKIPDGLLQVKVRAISPKGNFSRYRFLEFHVGDPFNTNVTRVQEGIPKGLISTSKLSVNNLNTLVFEVDPATVVSLGDSLGGSRSIPASEHISLAGIINTPNVDHHVLLDGNQLDLVHYNTSALEGIGFWQKISDGQNYLTPLLSNWTTVSGSGVSVAASTNQVVGTGTSFTSSIKPRDIITFGTSKDLVPYSISAVNKSQTNVRVSFTSSIGGMLLDGSRAIIRGTSGSTELNDTYYFVDKISQTLNNQVYTYIVELHTTEALNSPILSSNVSNWTSGGTIVASPFAATVIGIVNDTTLIIDKTFDTAISGAALNYRTYRPSYSEDSIFAKVFHDGSTFQLSKYITLDETLVLGKQVVVNVSDSLLQYEFNSPNTQLTSPGDITATATAIGFKDPVFKVTSLSTNLDGSLDTTYQDPNVGTFGYSKIIDDGTIAYDSGVSESVTIEAAEKFNNTLSITGTGVISKVTAGSDGISGKTVNITSEDLSIIYDEKGLNPAHNGTGSEIDFTASSTNFTNPVYKFTVTPGTGVGSLTLTQTGTPDANGFYSASTATLTVPADHTTWNSAKKEASALITVQVAESGATGTVLATDQVIVRAIHALSGGFWTSFSNLSASIPTTSEGVPIGAAGNTSGHILGASTGTTIEVGKGSTILTYTSGTPGIGQYTLAAPTETPSSAINRGTFNSSDTSLVSYSDAEFSTTAWTTDTATLTYTINVQGQQNIIRRQVFTKSKEGFGGVTVLQTNPSESVPVDKNGAVTDFSVTANAVNLVSSSGVSIPFYVDVNAVPAGTSNWWTYGGSTPSGLGFPSTFADEFTDSANNGSTGFIDIGAATSMTPDTASVTYSLVLHRGATSETFFATQNISKNTNASNISATVTVPHYNYSSSNVATPSTGYTLNWITTSPIGTTEVVTVDGTTETGTSKTYSNPAYSSGTQITHTVRLYNGSVAPAKLLDTDVVTVSKSKDGTSITSTQEYYKLTNSSTAPDRYSTGTTIDTGWTTTPPQPTSSNKYLWNFNRNTKSSGATEDTNVVLLSTLVKSITTITEAYQLGTSATSVPTGSWSASISAAGAISATNPYMWNRTTIAYTDGSANTVVYSLIAARGDDGVSYTGTTEYYKLTNSSVAPDRYSSGTTIDSGWTTSPSIPTSTNQYLWNFNRNNRSDGNSDDSAVSLITQFVEDGRGIASITEAYQKHTSETSPPTGTWQASLNSSTTLSASYPYLWNRTTIAYDDGSANTVVYNVIAVRGADGVSYTGTVEYYRLTNSATAPGRYSSGTTIATQWSTSPSTPTSTNQYLWNFNRNNRSDGNSDDSAVSLITQFVEDGRGISSITEAYQKHTSETSYPTGTWQASLNSSTTLSVSYPYLWNRTTIAYDDGSANTVVYNVIAVRGDDGTSAKVVQLTAADYSVVYNQDGQSPDPSGTIALTASAQGFTAARYKFTGDGVTNDTAYNNTTGTDTFAVPTTFFSTPKSIRVGVAEAAAATTELAFDTITITAVKPGIDAEKNINLGLITSSNISLDSTLEKVSKTANDNSWNGQVYSTVAYTGGAKVEFSPNQNNRYFMMGLNTDPATDANHSSIDYHWYCVNDGTLRARVNGSNAPGTPSPNYAAGDILSVVYDNDTVTWLQNGIVRLQLTAARNLKFHLDSSFYDTGTDLTKFFDFAPSGAAALAYTVVCTNENHTFPAASNGTVSSYTGSGTTFEAYRGGTRLQGINSGTPTRGEFKVTAGTDTNITKSSTHGTPSGNDIVFTQHGGFTGTTGSIDYSINLENEITNTKKQTFTKASDGTNGVSITGPTGDDGRQRFTFTLYYTAEVLATATPPAAPNVTNFTFSSGAIAGTGLTNWSASAPTFSAFNSSNQALTWYGVTVSAVESLNGTVGTGDCDNSPGSGGSVTEGSVHAIQSFTGIVSFSNLSSSNPTQTIINGANITTGRISSASSVYGTNTNGNFATSGTHFDLANGRIRSPDFYIDGSGAKFKGTVEASTFKGATTIGSASTDVLTVGTGTGTVKIEGSGQRIIIKEGTTTRVILGKL